MLPPFIGLSLRHNSGGGKHKLLDYDETRSGLISLGGRRSATAGHSARRRAIDGAADLALLGLCPSSAAGKVSGGLVFWSSLGSEVGIGELVQSLPRCAAPHG